MQIIKNIGEYRVIYDDKLIRTKDGYNLEYLNIDYNKEFVYSNGVVNSSGMLVIPPYVSSFTISVETYNDDLFKNSIYLKKIK